MAQYFRTDEVKNKLRFIYPANYFGAFINDFTLLSTSKTTWEKNQRDLGWWPRLYSEWRNAEVFQQKCRQLIFSHNFFSTNLNSEKNRENLVHFSRVSKYDFFDSTCQISHFTFAYSARMPGNGRLNHSKWHKDLIVQLLVTEFPLLKKNADCLLHHKSSLF